MAPLTSVKTPVEVNLKGVHIQGGDYNSKEVQAAVGNDVLLEQACNVMVNEGRYRRSWIVFVSGIKNAVRVREMLERRGVAALDVTSANTAAVNAQAITAFRSGQVRCLVSANQLTTGFDVPQIDLLAVLRPTVSPSLHVQMLGRGTRPCLGKVDCLVLDFAHNIARLGPINDPFLKERKPKGELTEEEKQEEKEEAELLPRTCPNCGALLPPRTRSCPYCGYVAPQELDVSDLTGLTPLAYIKHTPTIPSSRVWQVSSFVAGKYQNKNTGMHMLRVRVGCTGNGADFNAHFYLNFDSLRDPVRFDAAKTWLQFGGLDPIPRTVSEAIARAKELKAPREIELIKKNWYQKRNYDELIRVYYD